MSPVVMLRVALLTVPEHFSTLAFDFGDGLKAAEVGEEGDKRVFVSVDSDYIQNVLNAAGVTIADGPTVTKELVDINGQQIHSVADGTSVNDAVNLGQLRGVESKLDKKNEKDRGNECSVSGA